MKKVIVNWICAFCASFALINVVAFVYNHDAKWLKRDGGATEGIYAPGHFVLRTDEGVGFSRVDKNGYLNSSTNIGDDYIIAFGKSQTNAVEMLPGQRYVDKLNTILEKNKDCRRVYCVARGGNTFSDLICGFKALVQEFPNASTIIMEISYLDSAEEIRSSLNQREYNEMMTPDYLLDHQEASDIIAGVIKEYFPILAYYVNYVFPHQKLFVHNAFWQAGAKMHVANEAANAIDEELDKALALIRSEYDGNIIILYHPDVGIEKTGEMSILYDSSYNKLEQCCLRNGIELCDSGEAFLAAYRFDYSVPYGFWNTQMGVGHLNYKGHDVIAKLLYEKYFCE